MLDLTTGTSENLPALYRSVLTLVDQLEHCGARREAGRIRIEAMAVYGSAWDLRNHRRLAQLEDRLRRSIASNGRSPRRRLRLP